MRGFHLTGGQIATSVSIVIPTYREAANLAALIRRLSAAARASVHHFDIIIVDDNSRDGSAEIVETLASQGHPVRLIVREAERGLSSAVLRGFSEATGDFLVCMDADLSHPPETIAHLLAPLAHDRADFVIGSRYVAGGSTDTDWSGLRWLNSKIATLLARPFTRARDPMSGFFALRRGTFERGRDLSPVGYKIGLELLVKCRCRHVAEIPIHFADRRLGESKLGIKEQWNYLRHLKRLFDYKYGPLSRFVQFCVVGASGVIVDLGCYALLLGADVAFIVARAMAICAAMTWNFWFNRYVTFSYSRRGSIAHQYWQYLATCALGAALNWSASVSLTMSSSFFNDHKSLAAIVGILTGTVCNFLIASRWVFREGRPAWQGSRRRSPES